MSRPRNELPRNKVVRRPIIGVMGAGANASAADIRSAFALGSAIANEDWVLLSGGRDNGVMDAVNKGAKASGGLTVGILPTKDKRGMSQAVDIPIVTDMGSARNYINVLSSDVVVTCGVGGAGTASEVALALKAGKPVILLNGSKESRAFFKKIGGRLVHLSDSVSKTVKIVRQLLSVTKEHTAGRRQNL